MANKTQLMALLLSGLIGVAQADEKEELLKLRNTTTNLIKQLVKQGILSDKMANEMIKQAEVDADRQVAEARAANKSASGGAAGGGGVAAPQVPADEVRVSYVPDFVKDEIRQQVRNELREEVVGDVMQKAKQEQWGLPGALPEWTKRFKMSGDLRLREQSNFMDPTNIDNAKTPYYYNFQTLNTQGNGISAAGVNALYNTTQDRNVSRERFRLGIDVDVAKNLEAGIRLATGNTPNPVSTNQTLGNTGAQYQFNLDRAYLRYNLFDENNFNWLSVLGGRTINPFFTAGSEVVWDEDLSFEGFSATARKKLSNSDLADDVGSTGPVFYATAGIFPLQTANLINGLSSRDKWLYGGQTGLEWAFDNQDNFKFGAAYYDYQNMKGVTNTTGQGNCANNSGDVQQSVPQFMQGGNSLIGLCNIVSNGVVTGPGLFGLATDYKILDFNVLYDLALFSPLHVKFSGDFAKNIGYDANRTIVLANYGNDYAPKTIAWQFKVDFGWTKLHHFGNWNVFGGYRYVERDAVLDAYTDSDFHNGGTNVKGWLVGGNYALMRNVWLTGRWMAGSIITGPQWNMDVMQMDLNTRF